MDGLSASALCDARSLAYEIVSGNLLPMIFGKH